MNARPIFAVVVAALAALAFQSRMSASEESADVEADGIRLIETRRLQALENGQADLAKEFHAEDYQLITPSGAPMTRDEYLGSVGSGMLDYLVFKPASPIAVRLYGDAAVIRYETHIESAWNGVRGRGGRFWHTDVYERRDGRWQVVWSQATMVWPSSSPKEEPNKTPNPTPGTAP